MKKRKGFKGQKPTLLLPHIDIRHGSSQPSNTYENGICFPGSRHQA